MHGTQKGCKRVPINSKSGNHSSTNTLKPPRGVWDDWFRALQVPPWSLGPGTSPCQIHSQPTIASSQGKGLTWGSHPSWKTGTVLCLERLRKWVSTKYSWQRCPSGRIETDGRTPSVLSLEWWVIPWFSGRPCRSTNLKRDLVAKRQLLRSVPPQRCFAKSTFRVNITTKKRMSFKICVRVCMCVPPFLVMLHSLPDGFVLQHIKVHWSHWVVMIDLPNVTSTKIHFESHIGGFNPFEK